ncbi:Uncharacterized protein Rs2_26526 [Raphanus sativus]|nr:Uncharacterized protein Rs2_26526 [Raphanus sativus]
MNSTSNQLLQPTTTSSTTTDRSLRKRKTKSPPSTPSSPSPSTKWRSEKQQHIYTTKLARALRELSNHSTIILLQSRSRSRRQSLGGYGERQNTLEPGDDIQSRETQTQETQTAETL